MPLMTDAGCAKAEIIGTQLYSKETGRCTIGKDDSVTFAVFASDQLRDEWVKFGASFGGNFAAGSGWAVYTTSPDVAQAVAVALGGKAL